MHRFFVPAAALAGNQAVLREKQAHQISNVLRLRSGERISLFDDSGWEYQVSLVRVDSSECSGDIVERRLVDNEPRVKITIYQALLKGSKFDLIVQKGVEMGVAGFVPVLCARSVMGDVHHASEKKAARWRRIAIEGRRAVRSQPAADDTSWNALRPGLRADARIVANRVGERAQGRSTVGTRGGGRLEFTIGPAAVGKSLRRAGGWVHLRRGEYGGRLRRHSGQPGTADSAVRDGGSGIRRGGALPFRGPGVKCARHLAGRRGELEWAEPSNLGLRYG